MADLSGKARTRDGSSLFYRIYPQAGKPKLALIHSLALDSTIWDGVVGELSSEFELLTYDCRGHGQSERRSGDYTARLFGEDLAALLDHCGWTSAVIAGCSMGGCVAQAFAGLFADRAQALALIDTTAWYGPTAPQDWRARAAKAVKEGLTAMLPFQLKRWFSEDFRAAHPSLVDRLTKVFLANDMSCYQSSCALLGEADLRSVASSLRIPVSVIVGEEDYATPLAMSQVLHSTIAGSTLTVIPGARHLTPVQAPSNIATLIRELVRHSA
ncbi:MAG TPA: alpha/beta fold hydrolase [Candidatus Dormibacteraeota bacterium]|nr:alpha/beta fold hydrolase [Candidatus Dormibacteraeota bacterium]